MPFPEYPKDLEYTNWDKKKALLTPETGIGKELKAIKISYEKINADIFTDMEDARTAKDLEVALKKAETEYGKSIKPYHKELLDFMRKVDGEVAKAKKSATFPKASRTLMEAISTAALNFATTMRDSPDNMKKVADKRLENIKLFGETRKSGVALTKKYLEEIADVHKRMKLVAGEVEKLAEAATNAARDGQVEEATKLGRSVDKYEVELKKLETENTKAYKDMTDDKVIAHNRTTLTPSKLGLTKDDVAEFYDLWNEAVEKIRLITDHYSGMNSLAKEVSVDIETARNAVAHASRSASDWIKDFEKMLASARQQASPIEELAKKLLARGGWLVDARKGVSQEDKKPALVSQARSIISEIESNMGRVTEGCGTIQRQMQKQIKAMPPALQRERTVKPIVDDSRTFYLRMETVMQKTKEGGNKVIEEYKQFVEEHEAA